MAAFQNFRSALNGFNREDVVHYIEYLNNVHNTKIGQLNTEIQNLNSELEQLQASSDLTSALESANARITELEQALADANAKLAQAQERPQTESELEAYRRAERAERIANERVTQMYQQANGILSDATVRADDAAAKISSLATGIASQLSELQGALVAGSNSMKDTAAAMYAIRPIQE